MADDEPLTLATDCFDMNAMISETNYLLFKIFDRILDIPKMLGMVVMMDLTVI